MRKTFSASTGQRGFHPLRVLVADDSRVERKVVSSILERRGHRVTVAADGREALTLFHENTFDAAISATLPEEQNQGIDRYLPKPIDPDRLAAAVEGEPEPEPATAAPGNEGAVLGERVVFDLGEALTRARGKRSLLAELVRIFLEDANVQMLALRAALDAADLDRIERSAHRLKGSAMNVSAQLTADVALQIEQGARAGQAPLTRALWEKLEAEVFRARKALAGFLVQNGEPGAAGGFGLAKEAAVPRVSSVPFGSSLSP